MRRERKNRFLVSKIKKRRNELARAIRKVNPHKIFNTSPQFEPNATASETQTSFSSASDSEPVLPRSSQEANADASSDSSSVEPSSSDSEGSGLASSVQPQHLRAVNSHAVELNNLSTVFESLQCEQKEKEDEDEEADDFLLVWPPSPKLWK